jgi:hypothetical protein
LVISHAIPARSVYATDTQWSNDSPSQAPDGDVMFA